MPDWSIIGSNNTTLHRLPTVRCVDERLEYLMCGWCFLCSGVDGWLARKLGQTSRFGAWLDVVVDNMGRGMLWSQLFEVIRHLPRTQENLKIFSFVLLNQACLSWFLKILLCCDSVSHLSVWLSLILFVVVVSQWGWLVSAVEWCVFVCNHSSRGDHWKNSFSSSPAIIRAIMDKGNKPTAGL